MSANKRIALVVHDFDPRYGQGKYSIELVRALHGEFRFEVFAATFCTIPGLNIRHERIPVFTRNTLLRVLSFLVASEARLRKCRDHLIHAQGLTCWSADVITGHVCNGARSRTTDRMRFRDRVFQNVITPLERQFYQSERPRHLIALSHRQADEFKNDYGWRRPVSIVPHGVDSDHFSRPTPDQREEARRHFGIPSGQDTWLFVGEATRGLNLVIRLLERFPDSGLLVVSRSDPAPYVGFAAQRGVGDRLRFPGALGDPLAAYHAADLFVYPTPYDAFGMVVMEAMACGLPVIVGREAGAAEWIQHGKSGLHCNASDIEDVERQLRTVVESAPFRAGLGGGARAEAQVHSWAACADQTAAIYRQVLRSRCGAQ